MKVRTGILFILALIAVSFFAGHMYTYKKRKASYELISTLSGKISTYETRIDTLEVRVWEKTQLIGTQEQAIEAGLLEIDRLKALRINQLTQITRLEGELQATIDNIPIPDTVFITRKPEVKPGNRESYLKLPFSTGHADQYLSIDFGVNEEKTGWFDLEAKVPLVVALGGKKGKSVAAVTTPSPYINITDFNVVRIEQTKWYYKPWVPWAGGFVGGFFTGLIVK